MTTPRVPVLVTPSLDMLAGYEDALARGWSPDPRRVGDADFVAAELSDLRTDRAGYLDKILGRADPAEANPSPTTPINHAFWISDGEFAGKADLRYIPVTGAVPDGVPGHVGFSVVPWKQRRGYATAALRELVELARSKGLRELQILCNIENMGSRVVIESVGGEVDRVGKHASDRPEQWKVYYRLRVAG